MVVCLFQATGDVSLGAIRRSSAFSMAGVRPAVSRAGRVKVNNGLYDSTSPLDPYLIPGDLPYNAKQVGFTTAIEHAVRNRDLAAVRQLEQARVEVMEKTANGGSMGKWEEAAAQAALRRREQLMDLSIKRREKEDELVAQLKREGQFSINDRDQYGFSIDLHKIVHQTSDTLVKAMKDYSNGPRLISMRIDVDPMPWWDTLTPYGMELRTVQLLKEKMGYRRVVLLMEDPWQLNGENTDGIEVGRLDDANFCYDADAVVCLKPELDTLDRFERVVSASRAAGNRDVVVMTGNWGFPSDRESKYVRQHAKEVFTGGLQAIGFKMDPVKLVPNIGGEPYPLPQWLIDAGYKSTGNVAITGNSGTGKSSLNNALRGLKPRQEGAAAVGVKETTIFPEGYDFEPAGPEMKLWDLPGAGTPKFPLDSYMRTMGIKYFDEVVIASAARFTETDLELMDELRSHGVPFIALRTKVDLELRNAEHDAGRGEQATLERIREDIQKNSLLPMERIFLVSARRPNDFDFPALRQYIIDSLHRGVDVKLAKALNRKLDIQEIYNSVV